MVRSPEIPRSATSSWGSRSLSTWGSRALSSCGWMIVVAAVAGNTATNGFDLPLSPSIVHAESIVRAESHSLPSFAASPSVPGLATPTLPASAPAARSRSFKVNPLAHLKSGMASWYGKVFQDHTTASGERFDKLQLTAAHRDLPFGSRVRVTDLRNRRSVIVTITDRGIMTPNRVIDLSFAAAEQLGMIEAGVAPVSLELLAAKDSADAAREMVAALR